MPKPLLVQGSDPRLAVTLASPLLLAPMEGITEPIFRDLVIALGGVGAACTEFVRIARTTLPRKVLARHYGAPAPGCAVGIQLMAGDPEHVTETVRAAEEVQPAFIDLNFGCPAPVVFSKCAGSALLADPAKIASIILAARAGTGRPVTVKVRAGIDSSERIGEVVHAAAEAGAAMLTVHGRLRVQGYHQPATWQWIADAVRTRDRVRPDMPIVGNGSIDLPQDADRMMEQTGCDGVMIGRGALADPWIFARHAGAAPADARMAVDFVRRYGRGLAETYGERTALARGKQLIKYIRAGDLFAEREDERQRLLRVATLDELLMGVEMLLPSPARARD